MEANQAMPVEPHYSVNALNDDVRLPAEKC